MNFFYLLGSKLYRKSVMILVDVLIFLFIYGEEIKYSF